MFAMTVVFTILLVLAMLGTLTVLGFGVASMLRGGDPRRSNKLMQSRVIMQALALMLLAALMLLGRHEPPEVRYGPAHSHLYTWRRWRRDLAWRWCPRTQACVARRGVRHGRRGERGDRDRSASRRCRGG